MSSELTSQDLADCLSVIISKNPLWNGKSVYLDIIVNPTAGCFKKKKKAVHYKKVLVDTAQAVKSKDNQAASVTANTICTEYAGHAKEITVKLVEKILDNYKNNPSFSQDAHIIITAGGDGTSLEVQTSLFKLAHDDETKNTIITKHITLIRLPLGTGNDGTDGHTLEETMNLLQSPLKFKNAQAVRVYPEKTPTPEEIKKCKKNPEKYSDGDIPPAPWYAFNSASIGIDAYVCYLTNAIKRKLPGNIYQMCVILSAFVYDKDLPTGTAHVEYFDKDGNVFAETDDRITFVVFGKSGHSTYGGGHLIFPTDDNVCFTKKISLPKLIMVNNHYIDGSYINNKKCSCSKTFSAEKIRINYDKPILVQCDGETVLLTESHFPLIMEKTEPCIQIIERA